MRTNLLKLAAGAVLLGTWAYLVSTGKTEAPALVDFIKYALFGLTAHTVFKGDPNP